MSSHRTLLALCAFLLTLCWEPAWVHGQDTCDTPWDGTGNIAPPQAGCLPTLLRARRINTRQDWDCMRPCFNNVPFFVPGAPTACAQTCLPYVFYVKNIGNSLLHIGNIKDAVFDGGEDCSALTDEIMNAYRESDDMYSGRLMSSAKGDYIQVVIDNSVAPRSDPATFTAADVHYVFDKLRETFNESAIGLQLRYFVLGSEEQARARGWVNANDPDINFPIAFATPSSPPAVISYSPSTNYGFVRIYHDLDTFASDLEAGVLDPSDIPVLPQVPFDVEAVLAGVVTAQPAAVGNHVVVRSINRGTPFVFVDGALAQNKFGQYGDKLIQLTVNGDNTYQVRLLDANRPQDLAEARAFWNSIRPNLSGTLGAEMRSANLTSTGLASIKDPAISPDPKIYGGKGANLIKLIRELRAAQRGDIVDRYIVDGFVIPFSYYEKGLALGHVPSWTHPDLTLTAAQYTSCRNLSALEA